MCYTIYVLHYIPNVSVCVFRCTPMLTHNVCEPQGGDVEQELYVLHYIPNVSVCVFRCTPMLTHNVCEPQGGDVEQELYLFRCCLLSLYLLSPLCWYWGARGLGITTLTHTHAQTHTHTRARARIHTHICKLTFCWGGTKTHGNV